MFIDEVIKRVYPVKVYEGTDKSVAALGKELDRIYNQGGTWTINGISPTMGEVSELYDVYKNIVHDGVELNKISTISKNVCDILKSLGFKAKEKGTGWVLAESKPLSEASRYTFNDLPDWAKLIVRDEFGERQTYSDLYTMQDFVELSYREGGDQLTFRVYKDGRVFER